MTKSRMTSILTFFLLSISSYAQTKSILDYSNDRIILEVEYSQKSIKDFTTFIYSFTYDQYGVNNDGYGRTRLNIIDSVSKCILSSSEPLLITSSVDMSYFKGRMFLKFLIEPGDSVRIRNSMEGLSFSGKGMEKFQLIYLISCIDDSLRKTAEFESLSTTTKPVSSAEEYFKWNVFLNKKLELMLPVLERYKQNLSPYIFSKIKEHIFFCIEYYRYAKFISLIIP